ncbi:hypothetical protein B0H10DRAFT_214783 [Mycena sp. CBHHK59/15]|nr:hypothetical protein B0H10DRAFT_214783 [Mycena sp. CBHHK59/15]
MSRVVAVCNLRLEIDTQGIHELHRVENLHIHIIAGPILLAEQVRIESDGGDGQLALASRAHGELQSSVHGLVVVRIILDADRECAQTRPRRRVLAEQVVDDLPREAHVEHAERRQRGENARRGDEYVEGRKRRGSSASHMHLSLMNESDVRAGKTDWGRLVGLNKTDSCSPWAKMITRSVRAGVANRLSISVEVEPRRRTLDISGGISGMVFRSAAQCLDKARNRQPSEPITGRRSLSS